MNISVRFIPQDKMRYDTLGDWRFEDGNLVIEVVNDDPGFPSVFHQFLIARHEMDEAMLCLQSGVTQEAVDSWDMRNSNSTGEPGDLKGCPYQKQHRAAMIFENLMAHEFGIQNYGKVE